MELLRHLHGGLDGLRAAADEEHARGRVRGQPSHPCGEFQRYRVHAAVGCVPELADLRMHCVGDLAPAMPDVAEPHAGQGVEVAVPPFIIHPDPVPARHDLRPAGRREVAGHVGMRPEMGFPELPQLWGDGRLDGYRLVIRRFVDLR
jgi:hypothetical protein